MSDFYALLGVPRECSEAEVKKAYRKLAMEFHPDRNPSAGAEAKFKEITEAYEVLRDPQKRSTYDRFGKAGVGGTGGFDYHHVDLSGMQQRLQGGNESDHSAQRDIGRFGQQWGVLRGRAAS